MRCPSCGAICKKRSMKCPECGAFRNKTWVNSDQTEILKVKTAQETTPKARKKVQSSAPATSLIEFPGVNKTSIPQWRKELGERVREAQLRKAREAILEEGVDELEPIDETAKPAVLELMPQVDVPPMNPLVVAALQRIERANGHSQYGSNVALATLAAYEAQPEAVLNRVPIAVADETTDPASLEKPAALREERVHNLAVVPPVEKQDAPAPKIKPKRLIVGDLNDPALNYLDSIPTTVGLDVNIKRAAPLFLRVVSAIFDLLVVGLLTLPLVGLTRAMELDLREALVITFLSSAFVVLGFLYLTISTALTGRTLGKRLLSLRVVDARTGLIPTGAQAAARAFVYIVSLATAGIVLLFTFLDRERYTLHDRFSRTAVVRV